MTLLEEVENFYNTRNLYEVLGVDKVATGDQIKKAYRKASLKVHPDRVEEKFKKDATKKFQVLSKVHYILGDEDRRRLYDEHGVIDSEGTLDSEFDWADYWRLLFPKITQKDVKTFMDKYTGSKDEEEDLISVYNKHEGDLNKISDAHIGYDEERTVADLKRLIEAGKIEAFENFTDEPTAKKNKRLRKFKREAREAAKVRAESESNMDDLSALIQKKNNRNFDDMISSLEAKYAKPKTSGKGTKRKRAN